ncbi:MAG: hypothetical protein M1825_003003 [Sarcosagium campestre]|nr:MAG: hypothetical protein M1825_003003 [Sarcosagium campestre]
MAPTPDRNGTTSRKSRAERARQYLKHGGVSREDSDDELGLEDHPWEWLYAHDTVSSEAAIKQISGQSGGEENHIDRVQRDSVRPEGALTAQQDGNAGVHTTQIQQEPESKVIVGARMGGFYCKVGDTVLLKAEGNNQAWVGIICAFQDNADAEDGESKCASFMWFSSEKEIRSKDKKRTDFLPNELYISPSWDVNPLASINGKAKIMSYQSFMDEYPGGKLPRNSKESGKLFVCRRGCNTRTATYTEEFDWEAIFDGSPGSLYDLIERIQSQTKATRKRKRGPGRESYRDDEKPETDDTMPKTPTKRRKSTPASTPGSRGPGRPKGKPSTPTHKKVVIKKPLEFTPLGTRVIPTEHLTSPYQIARLRLHVASVPATLPCRENEFSTVYAHLEAAISEGSGSCIYISGTPGTGKTATVREVVSQLNASVAAEELDDFIFVEINGMKVTDPHQSYSLLWEALKGDRVSPSHALDLLEREFSFPSPRRVPCVVLMDELDQLVTKNQSVMYNFFNWPGLRHSRLIVLAVANTMDLPERTLSNKISSRLGLTRITFPGYTHDQLMSIIESRLADVPGAIVEPDAIQFASRKVAAVSGDARRALDICRRAVELAEPDSTDADAAPPPTPSKHGGTRETGDRSTSSSSLPKVTIATIKRAINEATSSPLQQYLRSLPLASKLFLAALMARVRRTGVAESTLGDVLEEAARLAKMADVQPVSAYLLADPVRLAMPTTGMTPKRGRAARVEYLGGGGGGGKVARVYGLGGASMELMESGVVALEARKGERTGRVRLVIGEDEIKLALRDDADVGGMGFAS